MIYSKLEFPKIPNRPFIFTDFVATIDGKVFVKKDGYWPIGSQTDFETFTYLRAHTDVIIDGKGSASAFGDRSIETFNSESFKQIRRELGQSELVDYIILTNHPDEKIESLKNNKYNFVPTILSSDLDNLLEYLIDKQYQTVFIDGGPTLLASLIEQNMLDEIFLTISPKIYGNEKDQTLTMVEGKLFDSKDIHEWKLISSQTVENEVYLRYQKP